MSIFDVFQKKNIISQTGQNDGRYIELIPRLTDLNPDSEIINIRGKRLRIRLAGAGLLKGEIAAVSKAIGNVSHLAIREPTFQSHDLTVGEVREATIEELAMLPDSGVRTARILKALIG